MACKTGQKNRYVIDGTRLTVMSSMIPYFSQIVFESNAALHALVCSGDRNRGSGLSRSFAGEVHLDGTVVEHEWPH